MADIFPPEKRSAIMAQIKGRDTKPELLVRRLVHSFGYRFRLHSVKLPGKPDIVLSRHRKVIFVHGCFWHGHARCRRAGTPKSNSKFWKEKIGRNKSRDRQIINLLQRMGWKVLVIWQCQTLDLDSLKQRLAAFLDGS